MVDGKIVDLLVDIQIKERLAEAGRKKGEVVKSVEDLTCEKHPDAIFKGMDTIHDSFIYAGDKGKLEIYQCEECGEDKEVFDKSRAYNCPNCGIVVGEFVKRPYKSDEDSWRDLAGREGEHFHCRVCDTQLGSCYLKMS